MGQRHSACTGLALTLSIGLVFADEPGLSRNDAEARLAALKNEISQLQDELTQSRARFQGEQAELRALDLQVQSAALELRRVETRIGEQESELDRLRDAREAYLADLGDRRDQLTLQIVAAYRMGRESRLKLLLNQDSPARLSRMLAYYDYLSEANAEEIQELRTALATLERLQAEIDTVLQSLRGVLDERRGAVEDLQHSRDQRKLLLAGLEQEIANDQARLEELSRNQADLEALLQRLADALADIPTELGQYQHPRELRGQLPMPLKGRVLHAFGQNRAGGMNWQGWLIAADGGDEVRAIAYGRVAYADWLRGYGLIMIIDHGDGFMSLYGNNESLLFEPGDWVQPGQAIATVGDNPGSGQGLYFELRGNGQAMDPASWLKRP